MNYEFVKREREHQEGCPFSFGWWLKMWELANDRWYDYNEIMIHTEFDEEMNRDAAKKMHKYRELMNFIRERLWISSEEYLDCWMRRYGLEYDTSDPDKDLLIVKDKSKVIIKQNVTSESHHKVDGHTFFVDVQL